MGIPVVAGREFTAADRPEHPEGFVINRTFANRYWPGQIPVGKRIRYGRTVPRRRRRGRLEIPSPERTGRAVCLSVDDLELSTDVIFQVRTMSDPKVSPNRCARSFAAPIQSFRSSAS